VLVLVLVIVIGFFRSFFNTLAVEGCGAFFAEQPGAK